MVLVETAYKTSYLVVTFIRQFIDIYIFSFSFSDPSLIINV